MIEDGAKVRSWEDMSRYSSEHEKEDPAYCRAWCCLERKTWVKLDRSFDYKVISFRLIHLILHSSVIMEAHGCQDFLDVYAAVLTRMNLFLEIHLLVIDELLDAAHWK